MSQTGRSCGRDPRHEARKNTGGFGPTRDRGRRHRLRRGSVYSFGMVTFGWRPASLGPVVGGGRGFAGVSAAPPPPPPHPARARQKATAARPVTIRAAFMRTEPLWWRPRSVADRGELVGVPLLQAGCPGEVVPVRRRLPERLNRAIAHAELHDVGVMAGPLRPPVDVGADVELPPAGAQGAGPHPGVGPRPEAGVLVPDRLTEHEGVAGAVDDLLQGDGAAVE